MKVAPPPPDNEDLVSRPTLLKLRQVWVYALEKPVVFTVMFYGYVSIIGLIYNTVYFDRFGINILEFYEVQDFLLGGLRTPSILLVPLLLISIAFFMGIMLLAIDRANRRARRRLATLMAKEVEERPSLALVVFLRYHEFMEYLRAKNLWVSRYLILICIVGATALSHLLIITLANANSFSDRSRYCTYLSEGLLSDAPLALIGTSQGFYFLRGLGTLEVEVIPRKEVLRMTKTGTLSTVCTDHKAAPLPWL